MDTAGIADALRHDGAVGWPLSTLPADIATWRRELWRAARAAGLRVSIRRGQSYMTVEHFDHEQTEDERFAVADVLGAALRGERLSWDDALKARARQRLQLVLDEPGDHEGEGQ